MKKMLEKVDCLRFVRVKLNFLDDYADIQRGERLFSSKKGSARDDKRGAENRWGETFDV